MARNFDDSAMDVLARKRIVVNDTTKIVAEVYQYKKGAVSVKLNTVITKAGEEIYCPLKGFPIELAPKIGPCIDALLKTYYDTEPEEDELPAPPRNQQWRRRNAEKKVAAPIGKPNLKRQPRN
jgi:hypothetical protein